MKQEKNMLLLAARWLVILMTSLIVLPGHVFAEKPAAPKPACPASCGAHCPCCVSKTPASNPSTPLAPASSARTVLAKDILFPTLLTSLLLKQHAGEVLVRSDFSAPHFSVSLPLFARHCSFLL